MTFLSPDFRWLQYHSLAIVSVNSIRPTYFIFLIVSRCARPPQEIVCKTFRQLATTMSLQPKSTQRTLSKVSEGEPGEETETQHSEEENPAETKPPTTTTSCSKTNTLLRLLLLFVLTSCVKILLFPSYLSTDFLVHRHWKALTRHLPLAEWYFDNEHVNTRHTLDYPPGFALWESCWSSPHNVVTQYLLRHEYLDPACLALLGDDETDTNDKLPSEACRVFMRSTVILSDIWLWIGAWKAATAASASAFTSTLTTAQRQNCQWTVFLLIVWHPGLLWLDHVHFQYNGMLLGILLASFACLLRANQVTSTLYQRTWSFDGYILVSAALFALLLTFKHLYLTLSLWYFMYLLRRYCLATATRDPKQKQQKHTKNLIFLPSRLFVLAMVTVITLMAPFLPFVFNQTSSSSRTVEQQLQRMAMRLFPFSRGLVHDYWAGNIWAVYLSVRKAVGAVRSTQFLLSYLPVDIAPSIVAVGILLPALLIGAWYGWKGAAIAEKESAETCVSSSSSSPSSFSSREVTGSSLFGEMAKQRLMLTSFTYSALAAFMTAYHVHEKAILTTLLPMIVWIIPESLDSDNRTDRFCTAIKIPTDMAKQSHPHTYAMSLRLLLWESNAFGLLGLFPLLFEPRELLLKLVTYVAYMAALYHVLWESSGSCTMHSGCTTKPPFFRLPMMQLEFYIVLLCIVGNLIILEMVPSATWGKFEFAPLAVTSLVCAAGLLLCWARISYHMATMNISRS